MLTASKKILLCLICCFWSLGLVAQDALFTQQYANRLYLNPAFSGLGRSWSVTAAHRNQWPSLNGSFVTNQLSADYRIAGTKSAVGMVLQQDKAGVGGLQKLQVALAYAYHTQLTENMAFSAGLQSSFASLRVNYDNLVFGDQLSDNGQTALTSAEANSFEPTSFLSFAAGGLLYNNQFWAGFTVSHLNQPSFGFAEKTQLPLRYVASAGYKFYLPSGLSRRNAEFSLSPAVHFTHQQNLSRTDIALYTIYSPLTLGVIYKGVPVTGAADQDQSLGVIAGIQLDQLRIGFSHDVGLRGFGRQAGGANEVSLVFEQVDFDYLFRSQNKHKINHNIVCPAF
ncbi:PorP/SprF family type IX secretion system membrane protein [Pontibacter roseus]|uniref:PorP/SprF family type IX secretion system membrane protein n=1 Tax=Pontibacter roseus TaxID=336989 RepID=UPI00037BAF41|nr:type IX secretion system membrane protein PorP/SprF [Pontibacter roseus]